MDTTYNGAFAYEHSEDHLLEFFSKGGSIENKKKYYDSYDKPDNISLFKNAWRTGQYEKCMQLLFWVRDCRGGAGARKNFRVIINWLADAYPEWVRANIHLIPIYGRWDDLKSLYDTACEKDALELWSSALLSDDMSIAHLAAKWAGRQDFKLRNHMRLTPGAFRKLLVAKTGSTVETKMCSGKWDDIDFSKVPSVAGARYSKSFKRHQEERYIQWCMERKNRKVNASVLFPHDIVRLVNSSDDTTSEKNERALEALVESLFQNLPNYIENEKAKMIAVCDFSGSMDTVVSGSVTALDVSLALGLYCGDRLGPSNPFYRRLIPFSDHSELVCWKDMSVVKAIREIPNDYCNSTDIEKALNNLLEAALFFNVKKEDMINKLIILSDMQFNEACDNSNDHVIEKCIQKWIDNGYDKPSIIYWNLVAYDNQQATKNSKNVAMVSGFSPAILKQLLSGDDLDPVKVMDMTIEKYKITIPSNR